jgi:glycine/D-amino acid oxidase-like deaminating enzyme
VLLEKEEEIAEGATEYTTAFLTSSLDTDYSALINLFGLEKSKLAAEAHLAAIDMVEKITRDEKIACDFQRLPHYLYAQDRNELKDLRDEQGAMKKVGLRAEVKTGGIGNIDAAGYLELKDQATFHPLKYLAGVARAASDAGAQLYMNSEVKDIEKEGIRYVVQTEKGSVRARWVIAATYWPLKAPLSLKFKKGTYITYVMAGEIEKETLPVGLYADLHEPYHYMRVVPGESKNAFLTGGEDHRKEMKRLLEEKSFRALEEFIKNTLKEGYTLANHWKGPILEPLDGLAFIGPAKRGERMFYATGFSGTGLTYGTIAAMIFHDLITGTVNPWHEIFRADRTPSLKSLATKGLDYTQSFFGAALKNLFK